MRGQTKKIRVWQRNTAPLLVHRRTIGALAQRQSEISDYLLDARADSLSRSVSGRTTGMEGKVLAGGGKRTF